MDLTSGFRASSATFESGSSREIRNWSFPFSLSAPKSLILPPIMAFAPFSSTLRRQHSPDSPDNKDSYLYQFPPLFGLNMKFGNSEHISFPSTKINFSIESLTSKDYHHNRHHNQQQEEKEQTKSNVSVNTTMMTTYSENQTDGLKHRGRPSADSIQLLKQKSLENPYCYKCPECCRSFPRKKSLDTHRLIHSDVKPYTCDYPSCNRRFKQSGQLKTHVRLHTGEKPFKCSYPLCNVAFTHANRKCAQHPEFPLQRMAHENVIPSKLYENSSCLNNNENIDSQKVKVWLHKHLTDRSSKMTDCANKKNILESIGNKQISEESSRRLLSAVALIELQNQMNNVQKESL